MVYFSPQFEIRKWGELTIFENHEGSKKGVKRRWGWFLTTPDLVIGARSRPFKIFQQQRPAGFIDDQNELRGSHYDRGIFPIAPNQKRLCSHLS
jgi:hypothetical protein